jgi:hypothetical protein
MRAPVAGILADRALAERHEARRLAARRVDTREAIEGQVGALRIGLDGVFEHGGGPARVRRLREIGETQGRRHHTTIERKRDPIALFGGRRVAEARGLVADLRLKKAEDEAVVRLAEAGQPRLDLVGLAPLPLLLVELLDSGEGMDALRFEIEDLPERLHGAVQESGPAEVSSEARVRVRPLGTRQVPSVEDRLVDPDRLLDLSRLRE